MTAYVWAGILVCLLHSAVFSGLTIGFFGLTRLRLEVMAEAGDRKAARVLSLRRDANFLLATLVWGNVGVNVLLTLLTDSVLTGAGAFLFSTVVITCFGEIMPQAFFSRHALRAGVFLVPVIRFYGFLLFPVAKLTAVLLGWWLGEEGLHFFKEKEFQILLRRHSEYSASEVGRVESTGAANFLNLDDVLIRDEGEPVDEDSVIVLPEKDGALLFPRYRETAGDSFLQKIHESKKKWVILVDPGGAPRLVMDSDEFLRDALYGKEDTRPLHYCHRPIVVRDPGARLGDVLQQFKVNPEHAEDDVIDDDLILYWADQKRIITGADILGRLLRGIVRGGETFTGEEKPV